MSLLNSVSDKINSAVEKLLGVAMAAMTVVVFAQVVFRLTKASIPWSEEFSRYVMIYLVYLGASVGVKRGSHIAVEVIANMLPKTGQKAAHLLSALLTLAFFAVLTFFGYKIMMSTMLQTSPATKVKMGYIYAALPISGVLMIFYTICDILNTITGYGNEGKEDSNG